MTIDEMKAAFEAGTKAVSETASPSEKQQLAMILIGISLLQEFMVDHKRIADAVEKMDL